MREIKFRALALGTFQFVYGVPFKEYSGVNYMLTVDESTGLTRNKLPTAIDHKTVGQYTGRSDKKGNPIYEGDVLIVDDRMKRVVIWNDLVGGYSIGNCGACDPSPLAALQSAKIEVVGNVHQNPELIK